MIEMLCASGNIPEILPPDGTDWDDFRNRFNANTFTSSGDVLPSAVTAQYMGVYNNNSYVCRDTGIYINRIPSNFQYLGSTAYSLVTPTFGLNGTSYQYGNMLYCGLDRTGTGIWRINLLTGEVFHYTLPEGMASNRGVLLVRENGVYVLGSEVTGYYFLPTGSSTWEFITYTQGAIPRLVGAQVILNDNLFYICGGGQGDGGNDGVTYNYYFMFNPHSKTASFHPLDPPGNDSRYHNTVQVYRGYMYMWGNPLSPNISSRFSLSSGARTALTPITDGYHCAFRSKNGVTITSNYGSRKIQVMVVN